MRFLPRTGELQHAPLLRGTTAYSRLIQQVRWLLVIAARVPSALTSSYLR